MQTRLTISLALILTIASTPNFALEPSSPKALAIQAQLKAKNIDAAVELAEAWTTAEPNNALAWNVQGDVYCSKASTVNMFSAMGAAKTCVKALEKAVALEPTNVKFRLGLMQYYAGAPGIVGGGKDKALAQVEAMKTINPGAWQFGLGLLAKIDKNDVETVSHWKAAVAADPANDQYAIALIGTYFEKKNFAEAKQAIAAFQSRKPDSMLAKYQLGKYAALSGTDVELGLQNLDAILASNIAPDGVSLGGAHWRRGQILEKLGRKDEAIAAIRKAVALEPALKDAKADLKRLGG
jgi:tetratricopeptide (TPR) repeat protein